VKIAQRFARVTTARTLSVQSVPVGRVFAINATNGGATIVKGNAICAKSCVALVAFTSAACAGRRCAMNVLLFVIVVGAVANGFVCIVPICGRLVKHAKQSIVLNVSQSVVDVKSTFVTAVSAMTAILPSAMFAGRRSAEFVLPSAMFA